MHETPAEHAWSHVPQWPALVRRSAHSPPHVVEPAVHVQAPAMQSMPVPQRFPHSPQLFGSFSGTTMPPQVRQSSATPLQSSSSPLAQTSRTLLASQPHTVGTKPSACTQPQLLPSGQLALDVHRTVHTA
jgi:hypothetical protein